MVQAAQRAMLEMNPDVKMTCFTDPVTIIPFCLVPLITLIANYVGNRLEPQLNISLPLSCGTARLF